MRILQINTLFAPRRFGGAEVFLERLALELDSRGHEVLVACLSPEPARTAVGSVDVHELPLRNVYWPFDGQRKSAFRKLVWHGRNSYGAGSAADIERLIRREQPALVHTHNLAGITTTVWKIAHSHGIPVVHTIHDYALLCTSHTMFRKERNCTSPCAGCRVLSYPKRAHSQFVSAVVGVSGFVLDRHVENGYFTKAERHVIPNGTPQAAAGEENAVGKPSATLRVGYLGRLAPSKGIELMLESLAPLAPERCEILVAGAGEPAYEAELKHRFAKEGVRFLGHVPARDFLASIDVLVVPSLWHEPFGLVLCEAIEAGVPVVAAAVGGIPEVVQHGRCGLLFDRADGAALQAHVQTLASDTRRYTELSQQCREHASEHAFERTVKRYLHVYQQTLN